MPCVSNCRVIPGQEGGYVSHLVGKPGGNICWQRYIEEVVLAQLEVLCQLPGREILNHFFASRMQVICNCLDVGFVLGSSRCWVSP